MKYEVMVTAHCYKTVYAETRSEAIDKALFMVEDSDFEIDGAEITYILECD
jgi:hypothetical protein